MRRQKRQEELQRFEKMKEQQAEQAVWVAQVRSREGQGAPCSATLRMPACVGIAFQQRSMPAALLVTRFALPVYLPLHVCAAGACAAAGAAGA